MEKLEPMEPPADTCVCSSLKARSRDIAACAASSRTLAAAEWATPGLATLISFKCPFRKASFRANPNEGSRGGAVRDPPKM